MKHLLLLALLLPFAAQAANKCTGADGKVTYSDVVCTTSATGVVVDTTANSIDTSGLRIQAANAQKAEVKTPPTKEQSIAARQNRGTPGPCDHLKSARPMPTERESAAVIACGRKEWKDYRRPP